MGFFSKLCCKTNLPVMAAGTGYPDEFSEVLAWYAKGGFKTPGAYRKAYGR